jgi:hypothetical protein
MIQSPIMSSYKWLPCHLCYILFTVFPLLSICVALLQAKLNLFCNSKGSKFSVKTKEGKENLHLHCISAVLFIHLVIQAGIHSSYFSNFSALHCVPVQFDGVYLHVYY